jgi:tRNA(Ile2)-agmatinylcytidine synthase
MATYHLGFDDTDSSQKGCTTYTAALLVEHLSKRGATFVDYPNLIRLNPNVPWKTRGNGALCLRFTLTNQPRSQFFDEIIDIVEYSADLDASATHPGIVLYCGHRVPPDFTQFARTAIRGIATMKSAFTLIHRHSCAAIGFKKRRGFIGAVAAIGEILPHDHTYELIAYRIPANRGTQRRVSYQSVKRMDKCTHIRTFNNIDYAKKRLLITPRGPDPILMGIRGESALDVQNAFQMLQINEDIERWVIFRTNQGTDAHFPEIALINTALPYHPFVVQGHVDHTPHIVPGRHLIFQIHDTSGKLDCAAYEPTKKFRNIIRQLQLGDHVRVFGGVRPSSHHHPITLNVEKLEILTLQPTIQYHNPSCKQCNKRMTSMGSQKGFRCKKCHIREPDAKKTAVLVPRTLSPGVYLPPLSAHRHLTKPFSRYGQEKSAASIEMPETFWAVS